ncbi:uncharacterized protein zgc:113184 [Syngnathoides biaculeatus]|uniref:uncharacterized protein zgc:113184 n=1 Tax=Syngnathoides biaculeatus TaxID=300417 RepID=UPI002ADDCE93|nr:uncharacterized protein zgc:113184 [Syngnathoides biaculeatus]XP_061689399.1 uncharacterized protein zgc:113184 [Syngnathoides biaculeatus]XP_061689400.1 uncharacterized protein zgc:113184 [Syngnathoides biaculeatus]XP_061689401.1 uncharacterized protein zgc:113184 [Syngnathoides biaculeatus]XP_061689402.1 uncharacterized protein zgc:113184 [Syngnathoides biaculeatus]
MEAAYKELYQEFVRLRSLCLRQAALLHRLMTTLQEAKGASNGDLTGNCIQEIPVHFQGNTISTHNPAAPSDLYAFLPNENTTHLLAEDMSKLSMKLSYGKAQQKMSLGQDSLTNKFPCDAPSERGSHHQKSTKMSQSDRQLLGFDLPSLPGRLLMSDVTLQSNVCDFCQAVFPGYTTTKGEFLQHLHNHIT